MDKQLQLNQVYKHFGKVTAVDNVTFSIHHGEFLTLLGPSGSGKTTTLNMIAGFEMPSSGEILLEGQNITLVPPNHRGIGMVFQNYALFPHMTVYDNIAFPLKLRKAKDDKIKTDVKEILDLVKLPGHENRYPNQLSGGQQQRIALARALVFQPKILLMDEPLGALDKKLRDHMRLEIKQLQESLNITVIYVTHDQEEALTMSDRIAIMNEGRIVQLDEPVNLYEMPSELFVADFIGETNFLEGDIINTLDNRTIIETKQGLVVKASTGGDLDRNRKVAVAVRPEKIRVLPRDVDPPADLTNRYDGRIRDVVYMGEATIYQIDLTDEIIIKAKLQSIPSVPKFNPGEKVTVGWHARHGLALN